MLGNSSTKEKQNMKIYIGYDRREIPTYHTLVQSIIDTATAPVEIIPLKRELLPVYQREDSAGTTEFSLTRFLVPYLSNYEGWSLFMDCDMIVNVDLSDMVNKLIKKEEIYKMNNKFNSVYVCKHDYKTKHADKATGKNEDYPRKNWSSVMLFNNEKCKSLTVDYVNTATPSQLHRLEWSKEDIGELPLEYNWLVGEYEHNEHAKILHYTLGAPCFEEYKDSDHSEDWFTVYNKIV